MYATVENFDLQFEQRPMFLKQMDLTRGAKEVYTFLYLQFKNNITKIGQDKVGQYINVARSIIADALDMSVKTVIKYIKELADNDLIEDRRMGLNLVNRIYFKENPLMVKINSNEEVTDENAKLFEDARALIANLTNKRIRNGQVNQLLALCNNDLVELEKAVQYNLGKDIRNVVACLADTLRNKYYEEKVQEVKPVEPAKAPVKRERKAKTNKFCNIMTRDYDYGKIEMAENLKISLTLGQITEEEYNARISELGLF